MYNIYTKYNSSDLLLRRIRSKKDEMVKRTDISKYEEDSVAILLVSRFIEPVKKEEIDYLIITQAGKKHLLNGGYQSLVEQYNEDKETSFKQLLESCTNLLATFGVLNAVVLFSTKDIPKDKKDWTFLNEGTLAVNFCTYVLSILVLIEIIKVSLDSGIKKWNFHIFYLSLCLLTLGIGTMFIYQYFGLIIGFGFSYLLLAGFIWVAFLFHPLLMKGWLYFIPKKSQGWVRVNSKLIVLINFIVGASIAYSFFHFVLIPIINYLSLRYK